MIDTDVKFKQKLEGTTRSVPHKSTTRINKEVDLPEDDAGTTDTDLPSPASGVGDGPPNPPPEPK